jgi:hypothetical protein
VTNRDTISLEAAAKMLNIPVLAMGQLIFENQLIPATLGTVYLDDVIALKDDEDLLRRMR